MKRVLQFKDGSSLECDVITSALLVLLIRAKGNYYLVSKEALVNENK